LLVKTFVEFAPARRLLQRWIEAEETPFTLSVKRKSAESQSEYEGICLWFWNRSCACQDKFIAGTVPHREQINTIEGKAGYFVTVWGFRH